MKTGNVTDAIKSLDGKEDLTNKDETVTFRWAWVHALVGAKDDPNEPGETRLKKAVLAEKIETNDELELTNDEAQMILEAAYKHLGSVVILRTAERLDPALVDKMR